MKWTAEVYLVWFFGRGSTMWRMHFRSQWMAVIICKFYAMLYDYIILPSRYAVQIWGKTTSGQFRYFWQWEEHEYGINWGVKKFSNQPAFMQWELPGRR